MAVPSRAISPGRRALTGKVHIAKKELALSDDDYQSVLYQLFGKTSSAHLSDAQLGELIEHFKERGFVPKKGKPVRAGARKMADGGEHRKIRALWLSLFHLGVVEDAAETALVAFAKRVSGGKGKGIDALQWLRGDDRFKVIEALKSWAARDGGVYWVAYKDRAGNVIGYNDRGRVIEAQWRILHKHRIGFTFVEVLKISEIEGDRIIERQGADIRRAKAAAR